MAQVNTAFQMDPRSLDRRTESAFGFGIRMSSSGAVYLWECMPCKLLELAIPFCPIMNTEHWQGTHRVHIIFFNIPSELICIRREKQSLILPYSEEAQRWLFT